MKSSPPHVCDVVVPDDVVEPELSCTSYLEIPAPFDAGADQLNATEFPVRVPQLGVPGADGGSGSVTQLRFPLQPPAPAELRERTRKLYAVLPVRPDHVCDFVVPDDVVLPPLICTSYLVMPAPLLAGADQLNVCDVCVLLPHDGVPVVDGGSGAVLQTRLPLQPLVP